MKTILLFTMFSSLAWGLPILNESVGTNNAYTIYNDHNNGNLYYITPNYMAVARDEDGVPLFNYTEYRVKRKKIKANMKMIMNVKNFKKELEAAKAQILKNNSKAVFSMMPFKRSELSFSDQFHNMVESHNCNHVASSYMGEQSCELRFSKFGRYILRNTFRKPLTLILNFYYLIEGVDRQADGTFQMTQREYAIAGKVGGKELIKYPELFTDPWGDEIDFNEEKAESENSENLENPQD